MNITPFFLAQRILLADVYKKSISTMTIICWSGIFIGSFSLALITAIMNGFEVTVHKKMQGIHAHLIMQSYGNDIDMNILEPLLTKEFPEIKAFSPCTTHHILLRSKTTDDEVPCVALLKGIEPNSEQMTSSIAQKMISTRLNKNYSSCARPELVEGYPRALKDTLQQVQGERGEDWNKLFIGDSIIIGKQLAHNNNIALGDNIEILFIQNEQVRGRKVTLESYTATVSGIFDTGIDEFDNGVTYCSLTLMDKLFPNNTIEHINIALVPETDETIVIEKLHNRTGLDVYSWKSLYPALVATLKLEKYVSFFIIALILLVASMNIISLLFMQITQKRPDIALLKAIGMNDHAISTIFFIMGMTISSVASACGLMAAIVTSWILEQYPFITLPDTYYVTQLPVAMTWNIIGAVFCIVVVFSFIATWIPTRKIRSINISQVLRFEG